DIYWNPEFAGSKSFDSWLNNLRDNGITRQRYWGTPLPIWKCENEECNNYTVIGSVKELQEKIDKDGIDGCKMPENLHKPWIDGVKFRCEKCSANGINCKEGTKGVMVREPDILDVWIDAGVDSWACLDYPHREDYFKEMYPADFILEGIDQIRGWFNMLFVASMVSMEKPSYKAVYMHGFINDAQGRKMSKSEGNYILPEEVINSYGSETLRYYMIGGTKPGVDLNYNFDDMKVKFRNLGILWNLHKFIIDLKNSNKLEIKKIEDIEKSSRFKLSIAERYILSKLNSTLKKVTDHFEKYELNEIPNRIEELFLELSRTYVQLVRDKASTGTKEDKEIVLATMFNVINETLKMLAPICPMVSEKIYLNLKSGFANDNLPSLKEESIHFTQWPKANEKLIDEKIELKIDTAKDIIQAILSARETAKLGVRWPLKKAIVATTDKEIKKAVKEMENIIKTQTNVKVITIKDSFEDVKVKIKPNYKTIGIKYAADVPVIITHMMNANESSIIKRLEEKGCYEFNLNKKDFKLLKEDLTVEKIVPEGILEGDCRKASIFIDITRTPELDGEGYAREIIRRVQALRKKAGLQKNDDIKLCVKISTELLEMIENAGSSGDPEKEKGKKSEKYKTKNSIDFEEELKVKCGVKELHIGEDHKDFQHTDEAKIKGKDIWLSLEKVEDRKGER
ncbi:MAG: class I tRNA ligase family protein, partial [Candidatus Woesearchaeota archaeon]